MSTSAQINANRENAQHSTGPVTPEGKAAVSQNRTTHGLSYSAATFRVLPCEDQSDYDNLFAMLQMTHEPTNFAEGLLIVSMAQHRWLLDRATRLQEATFDQETGQIADQKLFSLYLRYATTHERAFHKCANELAKLRAEKKKAEIGFEQQKRVAATHQMEVNLHEMELIHREGKIQREKNDEMRAQWLFEKQNKTQAAA